MAELRKVYRVANPGRRAVKRRATTSGAKKRLTLKQKLHFGTARQRTAARAALSGGRKRTGNPSVWATTKKLMPGANRRKLKAHVAYRKASWKSPDKDAYSSKAQYYSFEQLKRQKANQARTGNPAQIITLTNPGTKRKTYTMAKRKTYRRRRAVAAAPRRRRRRNSGLMTSASQRGRAAASRRRNTGRRVTGRRRNSGLAGGISGGLQAAIGIIGGGLATSIISSRLPAGFNTGIAGYVATAAIAMVQGAVATKVFKNPNLGRSMTIGGFTYLALRLLQDFVPNLSLPFRIGAIAPSSFYTPQVPIGNSMINFQAPNAVMAAMPMPLAGRMGRVGRVR